MKNTEVRGIPPNTQIEAVLNEIEASRSSIPPVQTSSRKRREDGIESVAAALSKMTETIKTPQPIVVQDSGSLTAPDTSIIQLERATKVASTVTSLMELERKIVNSIQSLASDSIEPPTNTRRLHETGLD